MKILITGSNGQLGNEIKDLTGQYPEFEFEFCDIDTLDITNDDAVDRFFKKNIYYAVINCAAYTAVDDAESNYNLCKKVNSDAVENLVKACEKYKIKMIHISTDYVFDGVAHEPYTENIKTNPINSYGLSKRDGEVSILNSKADCIVLRTSWLYSAYGKNFVKTIRRLAYNNAEIKIISDQIGTPTNAADLANACLELLKRTDINLSEKRKIYHYSNEGVASWYDFASAIISLSDLTCKTIAISSNEFDQIAKRPSYSVLSKKNIKEDWNINIPNWVESLKRCINKINLEE